MKKKWTALLLLFSLLLTIFTPGLAQESVTLFDGETTAALFNQEKSIEDVVMEGNTLYILFNTGIYSYTLGNGEPKEIIKTLSPEKTGELWFSTFEEAQKKLGEEDAEKLISALFFWQGKLFGLNLLAQKAIPADLEKGVFLFEEAIELPLYENMDDFYSLRIKGVLEDQLFYISGQREQRLSSIDLNSGEKKVYKSENIQDLIPYTTDQWLAIVYDQEQMYNPKATDFSLKTMAFNPKEDQLTEVIQYKNPLAAGFAYNLSDEGIYCFIEGQITKLEPEYQEKPVGYVNLERVNAHGKAWMTENQYILWSGGGDGIIVQPIDPDGKLPTALNIYGNAYGQEEIDKAFNEKYPDVMIRYRNSGNILDVQQWISQMIQSGQDDIDIFFVNGYFIDIQTMFKKEYALPLSGSEVIAKQVERMYPYIQKALTHNGEIYGLLERDAEFSPLLGYSKKNWEAVGFTDEDIPKTFIEYLKLVERWEKEMKQENKGYYFSKGSSDIGKGELISVAVEHYVAAYQKQDEILNFDTPLFRKMMETIEGMNLEPWGGMVDDSQEEKAIFSTGGGSILSDDGLDDWQNLYLPLDEGVEPTIGIRSGIGFINPKSPRIQEALAYFEIMAENYSPKAQITLFQDVNDPIEDEHYEETLKQKQEELAGLKEKLNVVEEAERAAVQEQITLLEQDLARGEENKWLVSPKAIEKFNRLVPYAFIPLNETFYSAGNEEDGGRGTVELLLNDYIEGAISLDNFITEVNRRVQMYALENE